MSFTEVIWEGWQWSLVIRYVIYKCYCQQNIVFFPVIYFHGLSHLSPDILLGFKVNVMTFWILRLKLSSPVSVYIDFTMWPLCDLHHSPSVQLAGFPSHCPSLQVSSHFSPVDRQVTEAMSPFLSTAMLDVDGGFAHPIAAKTCTNPISFYVTIVKTIISWWINLTRT